MQFRNGIFIITEEDHCPLYNVREEVKACGRHLCPACGKPTCMTLAKELLEISSAGNSFKVILKG